MFASSSQCASKLYLAWGKPRGALLAVESLLPCKNQSSLTVPALKPAFWCVLGLKLLGTITLNWFCRMLPLMTSVFTGRDALCSCLFGYLLVLALRIVCSLVAATEHW